ncbi:hypothetical protein ALC60_00906 [Trachymyrmex zeteki]|uniref:Uncharacterized protein n=1 Tax=Mycetomoellerius zeteki TaxID=64791 RepID=A0A151XI52_9HYME|nr:hypothetical protein ALC60_00906 [Trachymyrmex zeteki]
MRPVNGSAENRYCMETLGLRNTLSTEVRVPVPSYSENVLYTSPVGMVRLQNERTGAKWMSPPHIWLHKDGIHVRVGVSRVLEPDALDSARLINFALW